MFLCLNTSTIRPVGLLDKIRLAGRHGFAGIELWLDDVEAFLAAGGQRSEIQAELARFGLQVPCVIALKGWADAAPDAYPAIREQARQRMLLAAQLGSQSMIATPPRTACDLERVTARYRDLLPLGRECGIRLAMEYLGFSQSVWRIDQAWQVVRDARSDEARLVLDSFHTFRGGSNLADLDAIEAGRICVYHVNDAPGHIPREQQVDADRVMPGDGILDLRTQIALLRKWGYRGAVSLELFNPQLWAQDPDQVVALGMKRLQDLLS